MRALILVDIQKDFGTRGALPIPNAESIFPHVNRAAREGPYQARILTRDLHPADHLSFAEMWGKKPGEIQQMPYGPQMLYPRHCVMRSEGAEFHPELDVPNVNAVVSKGLFAAADSNGAFADELGNKTGLDGLLRELGCNELDLGGWALDICVARTAVQARRLGYQVRVLKALCAAVNYDGSLARAVIEMHKEGVKIE